VVGLKLSRRQIKAISNFLFAFGFGVSVHAIANELYYKGGYKEILSPQGEWIGFGLLFIAWVINYLVLDKCSKE